MNEKFIIVNSDNTVAVIDVTPDFKLADTILAHKTAIAFYFARQV